MRSTDVAYARKSSWNPNCNTLEPERPEACVIAQQYSSTMLVSLRFQRKRKISAIFENIIASFYFFV